MEVLLVLSVRDLLRFEAEVRRQFHDGIDPELRFAIRMLNADVALSKLVALDSERQSNALALTRRVLTVLTTCVRLPRRRRVQRLLGDAIRKKGRCAIQKWPNRMICEQRNRLLE